MEWKELTDNMKWYIEDAKKMYKGKFEGECSICGLKFVGMMPVTKCPFKKHHKPRIDKETISRMLS